ncbi:chromosomal replication initiator protein DnaA [Leptospira wolffii]|uniref:Chromosomal replication initiator protein DnaA n=1 Tax=Leptospira wolffii TaxID=409998 RepID=A0A2M9ZEV0_9LEPT|nr:chromosomal replication initiator protein DnaA [Leptospira wolffii]PJZ66894.1 chromosomal replication initiator protein DnaA [Leptospira wolffii]TGK61862.1 chromosomal replication initiator protein DnaA [Leptospira wolffii]TGK65949.1 chromosomal replication initiator protein DnaA [Leptospira wolffii]TGK74754.1 chromosomal replication initiator protein DnaA [Leptospira wolffii]TGL30820.1 chromosomal replication initiator protein DnaA [Leptospira wolffii]
MDSSWKRILEEVSKEIPPTYFDKFIDTLQLDSLTDDRCILIAPSSNIKTHVEKKYQNYIEEAIFRASGNRIPVEIVLESPSNLNVVLKENFKDRSYSFNQDYTFDNFVVGNTNRLAYSAAMECVKNPAEINPLYLFGKVGVGKTHLLHAIGSEIVKREPWKTAYYVDIKSFMSEFLFALQSRDSIESFKIKYQSYNCLLIDDIQLLNTGAEKTQEEFFTIFNFLFERKRQIVIASDRPSSELPIHDRLKSRFVTGVQADIQAPDRDTRIGILEKTCQILNLGLSQEHIHLISDLIEDDTRALLGALNDLALHKRAFSHLFFTNTMIEEILKNRIFRKKNFQLSQDKVIEYISEIYHLDPKEIMGKSRKPEYVIPRHLCMYVLHKEFRLNKSQVGRMFNSEHTTVIHAVRNIENRMKEDKDFSIKVESILKRFRFQ